MTKSLFNYIISSVLQNGEHMKGKIYFGHPINVYDTELEAILLRRIALCFPGVPIENPNQKRHADGYKRYVDFGERGMEYYFKEVLPDCDTGVFLAFRDGAWGAGVFAEAKNLADRGCVIWQITPDGVIFEVNLDSVLVLSVAETKARIRTVSGEILPY